MHNVSGLHAYSNNIGDIIMSLCNRQRVSYVSTVSDLMVRRMGAFCGVMNLLVNQLPCHFSLNERNTKLFVGRGIYLLTSYHAASA